MWIKLEPWFEKLRRRIKALCVGFVRLQAIAHVSRKGLLTWIVYEGQEMNNYQPILLTLYKG